MADQVRASHILLMYDGSLRSTATRSKDEALQQIRDVKSEVDAGGDFARLAQAHSDCPSGQQGGDLGPFSRGMMVPEFEDTVFGLDVGGTSDVIETDFGYHLVHRTG